MSPAFGEAIKDPTSNDDYVAQLVASDARDRSLKYSALGLQAYLPRRPTDKAPKPNTCFLKNILRNTDNHNAALKRKEEEEARERVRRLRNDRTSTFRRSDRGGDKREYRSNEDDDRSRRHRRRYDSDESKDHHISSRSPRKGRRHDNDRSPRRKESSRSPNRSSRRVPDRELSYHHKRRRHPYQSPSRSPSRSQSPKASKRRKYEDDPRNDSRRHEKRQKTSSLPRPSCSRQEESDASHKFSGDDSDPLEDLIGPLRQSSDGRHTTSVASRGRGIDSFSTSNIDAHFAADYNANLDLHFDEEDTGPASRSTRRPVTGLMTEDDDWDMALEALRDRAHWKQKGAERLRAAGFGEQVVERWSSNPAFTGGKDGDGEGRVEDVRWVKKGERREWDRGKVMNEDGHYDVKAPW